MMTTLTKQMESMASGGTFKEISKTSFEKIKIPLPTKEIQNDFVKKIEEEQELIKPNNRTIKFFENKLKDKLNFIWGK